MIFKNNDKSSIHDTSFEDGFSVLRIKNDTQKSFTRKYPVNQEFIGKVSITNTDTINDIINRSKIAQKQWSKISIDERKWDHFKNFALLGV